MLYTRILVYFIYFVYQSQTGLDVYKMVHYFPFSFPLSPFPFLSFLLFQYAPLSLEGELTAMGPYYMRGSEYTQ